MKEDREPQPIPALASDESFQWAAFEVNHLLTTDPTHSYNI